MILETVRWQKASNARDVMASQNGPSWLIMVLRTGKQCGN